jgi:cystathionine beta-synthase
VGPSTGLAVAVALEVAAGLDEEDVVVVMAPDSGTNYLSTLVAAGA